MIKEKRRKNKSHYNPYWRKGWRCATFNKLSKIMFPNFDKKEGSYNDDF